MLIQPLAALFLFAPKVGLIAMSLTAYPWVFPFCMLAEFALIILYNRIFYSQFYSKISFWSKFIVLFSKLNLASVYDLTNLATLFTTAFYQPPGGLPVTRFRRIGHLLTLYYLPLLIYVPVGILCQCIAMQWGGHERFWFGPFEGFFLLIILGVSFLVGPIPYFLFSMIYYAVSLLLRNVSFKKVILIIELYRNSTCCRQAFETRSGMVQMNRKWNS